MSSEVLNDENQGTLPVRKHILSESAADIFALDQSTGRPSILRPSQVENVNKNIPKGVKVCFQTPLRDPVTKKIMSPSRVSKMTALDDCTLSLQSLSLADSSKSPTPQTGSTEPDNVQSKNDAAYPDDDMPIQSKGGYTIDFDNLESMNPFQSSASMGLSPPKPAPMSDMIQTESQQVDSVTIPVLSVPEAVENIPEKVDMGLDETLPMTQSVENSLAEISADTALTDNTVIIEPRTTESTGQSNDTAESLDIPEPASHVPETAAEAVDSPLVPKGAYKIDFDNLDSVNPFQTGGSKIQNSPVVDRKSPISNSPPCKIEAKEEGNEIPGEPEVQVNDIEKPSQQQVNTEVTVPSVSPPKEAPMVLEFNFDDGAEVKRKPPPKRLGLKRPPASKTTTKKPTSNPAEKKSPVINPASLNATVDHADGEILAPKGAYTIDFDKFDDLNFNPFASKAKMGGSPPHNSQSNPEPLESTQDPAPVDLISTVECTTHSSSFEIIGKTAETEPVLTKSQLAEEPQAPIKSPCSPTFQKPVSMEKTTEVLSTEFEMTTADDEFVPGSMFMPSDLDGQIDYLEQFGSNAFKESALRKQSLYLKFDPLLKESPKKAAFDAANSDFSLPRPSLAIRMMEAARSEVRQKSTQESTKLLEDFPVLAEVPVTQDPTVLDLLVPTLKQPPKSDAVIVDVLKFTQEDMDSALKKAHLQALEKEAELKAEIESLRMDKQHMIVIVSDYEAVIAQITAEHKQKEELAQSELSKVLQEKQQLAKDLNDMERSFSDVVKRLDRRKEVIEGFKKNEETLKQCAQSYLARLQKEEQRYQKLKMHAEEKIEQANKEIADVRSKVGAEISALQVQLRREQLKVQSLEKNLDQKTKEVEDVTKLCDELILKVQKC